MQRTGRPATALLMMTLVLGCTPGAPEAVADEAPAASDAIAPASDAPLPSLDAEREAALVAEGLAAGEAEFLALTRLESQAVGDNSYRVLATFPTGHGAEFTVTLEPDKVGDPADFDLSHEVVGDEFRFRISYVVPWEAIPPDLHDDIRQGGTALFQPDAILALAPVEVGADSAGVGVVIEALVGELYQESAEQTAEILQKRLGDQLDASNTLKMLDALKGVGNALASSADYLDLVRELNALEDCARNPTNPITQRAYRDDPGYRQRIVDQVTEVRAEVKGNFAVMYLSHLLDTGSGLLDVPGLGFIVGAGTAWSEAAIKEATRKLIDDLKKNITPCGEDYRIDKMVSATQMNVSVTIQYTGTKCDGVAGTWTIDSAGTLSGYGGTAAIGGPLTVVFPPESTEGTLEGTANFDDENQGHTEGHFVGDARFVEEPPTLELTVNGGSGNGYQFGFLDTGFLGPGTLTFPLEKGDFCN